MAEPGIALRPYQQEAIEAFEHQLLLGVLRTILNLPTGTGKTVTALAAAKKLGKRTLWIAHREELLTQPLRALRAVWPGAEGGIVKAERNERNARDIVFASVQTICNLSRLQQLGQFGLVIVDECHHAAANSYRNVIEACGCFRKDGPPLLGLSATVERSDNADLEQIFQSIAYQLHLQTAIARGYLVPVRSVRRPLNINLDSLSYRQGDWSTSELDEALLEADIVKEVGNAIDEHARTRKTVIFTVSVKQAHAIAAELRGRGYAADAIDGKMAPSIRREKLEQLAKGKLQIIANCAVLTEGFDEPSIDCVVMARPTASKTLYLQCVGRGLRLFPSKADCLVIDLVGVSQRHTLMQAPVLFGEGEVDTGCKSQKDEIEEEEAGYDYAATLRRQVQGLTAPRSRLVWVPGPDGQYCLPVGQYGTIVLGTAGDGWNAHVIGRRGSRTSREALCREPVSQELAFGVAEDYVRRVGALRLVDRETAWRSRPPTAKQIDALARAKIKFSPKTSGEAAELLATHYAALECEPATCKQIWALRRAGVVVTEALTKREAGRLIAQLRGAA